MSLKINITEKDKGVFIVSCLGVIDTNTYSVLKEKIDFLVRTDVKVVVLDMEGVNYVSSMGVSTILNAKKSFEKEGIVFIILSLQPQVKKVFDIVKALPTQTVFESIEELDNYLRVIQEKEAKDKDSHSS